MWLIHTLDKNLAISEFGNGSFTKLERIKASGTGDGPLLSSIGNILSHDESNYEIYCAM